MDDSLRLATSLLFCVWSITRTPRNGSISYGASIWKVRWTAKKKRVFAFKVPISAARCQGHTEILSQNIKLPFPPGTNVQTSLGNENV